MIRCRECGSLCEDHDERDACERGDQMKAAIEAARAEGAAAERARLVAVVRERLAAESPFQPSNVRLGLQMALEAMAAAAEGSEGR